MQKKELIQMSAFDDYSVVFSLFGDQFKSELSIGKRLSRISKFFFEYEHVYDTIWKN